jgi:hypothetical protein
MFDQALLTKLLCVAFVAAVMKSLTISTLVICV